MKYVLLFFFVVSSTSSFGVSVCYGTTLNGRLENGVKLPHRGRNYIGYSKIARLVGRTYVHTTVKAIVVLAYKDLENEQPGKVYKYAETGYRKGGQFKPHKTHRNGLSVDFMTPVVNREGSSVRLPTHSFNKYGYSIEFDDNNEYRGMRIDYESLAAHIVSLHKNAKKLGYDLQRVIFDPELQVYLYKTKYAKYLRKNIRFSKKRSWVRHDEHYHVDFLIPCSIVRID